MLCGNKTDQVFKGSICVNDCNNKKSPKVMALIKSFKAHADCFPGTLNQQLSTSRFLSDLGWSLLSTELLLTWGAEHCDLCWVLISFHEWSPAPELSLWALSHGEDKGMLRSCILSCGTSTGWHSCWHPRAPATPGFRHRALSASWPQHYNLFLSCCQCWPFHHCCPLYPPRGQVYYRTIGSVLSRVICPR